MSVSVNRGLWSEDEHDRFLEAIQIYPHGPWRIVAKHVETREVRQVQTHAQKYYEKIGRHLRGLHKERRAVIRAEHRIEGIQLPPKQSLAPLGGLELDRSRHTLGYCRQEAAVTTRSGSISTVDGWLANDDDDEPHTFFDVDTQLPSLEESIEILLQCLGDS